MKKLGLTPEDITYTAFGSTELTSDYDLTILGRKAPQIVKAMFDMFYNEMKELVKSIREIEKMIGNKIKKTQKDEKYIKNISRRSFYARQDISLGEKISLNKLIPLRPFLNNSYTFENVKKIIDKKAWKNFIKGDVIK